VARDRKRAKQRRERRGTTAGGRVEHAPPVSQPVRADLPGALEHTGDVDEFDAALVRGAGGVPAPADTENGTPAPDGEIDTASGPAEIDTESGPTLSEREIEQEAEVEGDVSGDQLQELVVGGGSQRATPEQASGAAIPRDGNRAIAFLRASWAELQRVQWPDRPQVFAATAVVLGFVAIAGAYLGGADYVAKEIVEFIL
jgi:preprotein translocase subunit SecE